MKKSINKKTIAILISLFVVVAMSIGGAVAAYWTAGIRNIAEANESIHVTVGKAVELQAQYDVEYELKGNNTKISSENYDLSTDNTVRLVPTGRRNISNTAGPVKNVEQLVLTVKVKVTGSNYTDEEPTLDKEKVKVTISFTADLTDADFNVDGKPVSDNSTWTGNKFSKVIEDITVNQNQTKNVTFNIDLIEPADKTAYERIVGKPFTINIKLERVN